MLLPCHAMSTAAWLALLACLPSTQGSLAGCVLLGFLCDVVWCGAGDPGGSGHAPLPASGGGPSRVKEALKTLETGGETGAQAEFVAAQVDAGRLDLKGVDAWNLPHCVCRCTPAAIAGSRGVSFTGRHSTVCTNLRAIVEEGECAWASRAGVGGEVCVCVCGACRERERERRDGSPERRRSRSRDRDRDRGRDRCASCACNWLCYRGVSTKLHILLGAWVHFCIFAEALIGPQCWVACIAKAGGPSCDFQYVFI